MSENGGDDAPGATVSRRRLATRARLMDAAREVFAAKGVHGSSVEEICDAAGFTRGAFYSNYADKDELTRDLLRHEQTRILDGARAKAPADDIDSAVATILAAQQPRASYFVIQSELLLHALRTREFLPVVLENEATYRGIIRELIDDGLQRLGLEPVTALEDITEAVIAILERSVRSASLTGEDDLLRLARTTLPHVLRGLTRPRGAAVDSPAAEHDS